VSILSPSLPRPYALAENVDLARHNTLRIGIRARWLVTLFDLEALPSVLVEPRLEGLPWLVLGSGSNVLFVGDYPGVVLRIAAAAVRFETLSADSVRIEAEAGADWDRLVTQSLAAGWPGLENLALIPGLAGAAPIQNIGAYGVELDEFVESVVAWDRAARLSRVLPKEECGFGYRDSRFRREADRWIVTHLRLRLTRPRELRLGYAGVRDELAEIGLGGPTPGQVAEAVRRLRRRKLPDPAQIGNAGSFFKNPVVAADQALALRASHPGLPVHAQADGRAKLSAAWLIEACGWRGRREGDAGISGRHALVLVNHGSASGAELLSFARRVEQSVAERFHVRLEPEPRIVGAAFETPETRA
jgi:UDP-N-acetylmuramate dehydrogenase